MAATASTCRLPAELKPESVVAIVDTREQDPWRLAPLQMIQGSLPTGDYTIRSMEHVVSIERKSLPDLLGCVGQSRERFDREVQRLLAFPTRALIVEASWQDLERGEWRSKVMPAAAIGSVLGWVAMGLPVILAGNHERAGRYASRLLFTAARRRWRELRGLAEEIQEQC